MPQPPTVIDAPAGQSVIHGTQVITFPNAGASVVEEIVFNKALRGIDWPDETTEFGAITSSAYSTVKGVGTMTVQFRTAASFIAIGDIFDLIIPPSISVPCRVTDIGNVSRQGEVSKMQVSFAERLHLSPLNKLHFFDNIGDTAIPCGAIRFSRPIATAGTDSLVITQRFCQKRTYWNPLPLNTVGPYGGGPFYLVEETQLQDVGIAGMVEWDRVWARKPASRQEPGSYSKTYKKLFKQWTDGNLTAVAIAARTKTIQVNVIYDYYLQGQTIGLFQGVPDVAVQSVGIFTWVEASDGFPFNPASGSQPDTNNYVHFLAGSIEPWMGAIYVRKTIYG